MVGRSAEGLLLAVCGALVASVGCGARGAGGSGGARPAPPPSIVLPAASGLYEGFSPITMAPFGPLDAAATARLPRWLEVRAHGDTLDVAELPEDRIHWTLRYGPYGLVSKRVTVDGELWLVSSFARDDGGRLLDKDVTGPGAPDGLGYTYTVDARGRVTERRRRDGGEAWWVVYDQPGNTIVATTVWKGRDARRDVFDSDGRLLRSELGEAGAGKRRIVLVYDRDAEGRLRNVIRRRGNGPTRFAYFDRPDSDLVAQDLRPITPVVERHEALLALGAPATRSDDGRGIGRTSRDQFGSSCWLNEPSTVIYDAANRAHGSDVTCICGFCVDATLTASAPGAEVLGRDWHWTAGPWVRLDGAVDVTADHAVLTPTGPIPAGDLRPGDLVLTPSGASRPLQSVELLPATTLRLGLNLRTSTDTFQAGDFVFASESPTACPVR